MIEVAEQHWGTLRNACRKIDDPRTPINIFHPVENIIAISLAAIIAGAEVEFPRKSRRSKSVVESLPQGA